MPRPWVLKKVRKVALSPLLLITIKIMRAQIRYKVVVCGVAGVWSPPADLKRKPRLSKFKSQ